MILFHGTSSDRLPDILKHGLISRDKTGVESNWEGDVESKADLVYLTTAYPVYFALAACVDDALPIVLKVDVNEDDLFPDEDFVSQVMREQDKKDGNTVLKLSEYNPLIDPRDNVHLAVSCLKHNGIAAIERVLPEQIVDVVKLEADYRLMWVGGDAAPIPSNYMILGSQYRRYTEALFEGGLETAFKMAQEDHKNRFGLGETV